MSILIRPAILSDESVFGYVQRLALQENSAALKPLVVQLFGIKLVQSPWLIPSRLEVFVGHLPDVLPAAEALLSDHTIYPAIAPFLKPNVSGEIRSHMLGKVSKAGNYFRTGLAHSLTASHLVGQNYCEQCVEDDILHFGFPYWRRTHQFPYIASCGRHGSPLFTGSGCCVLTDRQCAHARLPGRTCVCTDDRIRLDKDLDAPSIAIDRRVSRMLAELLEFEWPTKIDQHLVGRAYTKRFSELGYARGLYMASAAAVDDFRRKWPDALLRSYGSEFNPETGWFVEAVKGFAPSSVVRNALLISELFPSLKAFATYVAELTPEEVNESSKRFKGRSKVLQRQSRPENTPGTPEFSARVDQFRATLTTWLKENPGATRTMAQKQLSTPVMWLRERDRDWYEGAMPSIDSSVSSARATAQWASHRERADEEGLEHVKARYAALTVPHLMPTRITRAKLISGLSNKQKERPKTLALADELAENAREFRERFAIWVMTTKEEIPGVEDRLEFAYSRTRLPKREIVSLINARLSTTEISGTVCPVF